MDTIIRLSDDECLLILMRDYTFAEKIVELFIGKKVKIVEVELNKDVEYCEQRDILDCYMADENHNIYGMIIVDSFADFNLKRFVMLRGLMEGAFEEAIHNDIYLLCFCKKGISPIEADVDNELDVGIRYLFLDEKFDENDIRSCLIHDLNSESIEGIKDNYFKQKLFEYKSHR